MKEENKRELILDIFKQSILKDGYSKVSINSLTNLCNISKGSFYTYFSSKDELLATIIEEYRLFLKKIMKECTEEANDLKSFIEIYIKNKLKYSNYNLELEFVIVNLFENLESLSTKNLVEIHKLTEIHLNTLKKNLKKYTKFSDEGIQLYSLIIEGIREKFLIYSTLEIKDEILILKNLDEIKEIIFSKEIIEQRNFIIKNILKMLKI